MIGGLAMRKVKLVKKLIIPFGVFCFTLLMPLPGQLRKVSAAALELNTQSSTEEKNPEVKLNLKKKSLVKGTTFQLVLYNVKDSYSASFKSSDEDIASVDSEGVVSGNKIGEATITVTIKDGNGKSIQTLSCDVTVGVPAATIKSVSANVTLTAGKSTLLETILTPNNTVEEPKFRSSDNSIATVSSGGRITAKSAGTAIIYGSIANGQYVKVTIIVEPESSATPTPTVAPSVTPSIK